MMLSKELWLALGLIGLGGLLDKNGKKAESFDDKPCPDCGLHSDEWKDSAGRLNWEGDHDPYDVVSCSTCGNSEDTAGQPPEPHLQAETFNAQYNRRLDGTFETPDKVMYKCDKCGHHHEGFEIMGMKVVCPKCGDSYRIGVDAAETFNADEDSEKTTSGHTVEWDDGGFYMTFDKPIDGYTEVSGDWYGGDDESPDEFNLNVEGDDVPNLDISIDEVEYYGNVSDYKDTRWKIYVYYDWMGTKTVVLKVSQLSDELIEAIEEGLNWMLGDFEEKTVVKRQYRAESDGEPSYTQDELNKAWKRYQKQYANDTRDLKRQWGERWPQKEKQLTEKGLLSPLSKEEYAEGFEWGFNKAYERTPQDGVHLGLLARAKDIIPSGYDGKSWGNYRNLPTWTNITAGGAYDGYRFAGFQIEDLYSEDEKRVIFDEMWTAESFESESCGAESKYETREATFSCPKCGCRGCYGCYGEDEPQHCSCCPYVFEGGATGVREHQTYYCEDCDVRSCEGCIGEDDPSCPSCGVVFEHTTGPFDDEGNYIGNAESFSKRHGLGSCITCGDDIEDISDTCPDCDLGAPSYGEKHHMDCCPRSGAESFNAESDDLRIVNVGVSVVAPNAFSDSDVEEVVHSSMYDGKDVFRDNLRHWNDEMVWMTKLGGFEEPARRVREDDRNYLFAESFAATQDGKKVYVVSRRCEDYSENRELEIFGIFSSLTQARKVMNGLFKKSLKEYNDDQEDKDDKLSISEAKGHFDWEEWKAGDWQEGAYVSFWQPSYDSMLIEMQAATLNGSIESALDSHFAESFSASINNRVAMQSRPLKRDSCCCGATKSNPCACMIEGVMECSGSCPCALERKGGETFDAEKRGRTFKCGGCWRVLPLKDKSRTYEAQYSEAFGMGPMCRPCMKMTDGDYVDSLSMDEYDRVVKELFGDDWDASKQSEICEVCGEEGGHICFKTESFAAPLEHQRCVKNNYSLYGRKLFFDCVNVGSIIGNSTAHPNEPQEATFSGNQKVRWWTGFRNQQPQARATFDRISHEIEPSNFEGWMDVIQKTNNTLPYMI